MGIGHMTNLVRKIENGKKNYNTGSFLYHEKYCRESADIQPDNPGFFISGFRSDSGYGSTYQYPAGYRVRFSKKPNMSFLQKQFTKSKENSLISVSGIRPHRMWTSGIRLFRLAGSWCPASPVKRIDIEANGALFQSTGEQEATCRMSRLPKSPATQVSSDTSKSAVLRICADPKYLAGSDPWFFRLYYKHQ